jgi:hypothetical protein
MQSWESLYSLSSLFNLVRPSTLVQIDSILISIFRSKHHHLYRPWEMLPYPVQINFSRNICCGRQSRVNPRPSRVWTLRTHGAPKTCSGAACSPWLNHVIQVFALFMVLGLLTRSLFRKPLERLLRSCLARMSIINPPLPLNLRLRARRKTGPREG